VTVLSFSPLSPCVFFHSQPVRRHTHKDQQPPAPPFIASSASPRFPHSLLTLHNVPPSLRPQSEQAMLVHGTARVLLEMLISPCRLEERSGGLINSTIPNYKTRHQSMSRTTPKLTSLSYSYSTFRRLARSPSTLLHALLPIPTRPPLWALTGPTTRP